MSALRFHLTLVALFLSFFTARATPPDTLPGSPVSSVCQQRIQFHSGLTIYWLGATADCEVQQVPSTQNGWQHHYLTEIYPHTDLEIRVADAGQVSYTFHFRPGADPAQIKLKVEGARWVPWSGQWQLDSGQQSFRWERVSSDRPSSMPAFIAANGYVQPRLPAQLPQGEWQMAWVQQ